jgi:hypothetical protein
VTTKGNLPSADFIAVQFVQLGQQALAHLLEVRQRAVVREQPDAVNEGGVFSSPGGPTVARWTWAIAAREYMRAAAFLKCSP